MNVYSAGAIVGLMGLLVTWNGRWGYAPTGDARRARAAFVGLIVLSVVGGIFGQ